MDVSSSAKVMLSCLALCLAACARESKAEPSQDEVISYLKERVASATADLGKRIEHCDEESRISNVPQLNKSRLEQLNVGQQDVVVALGHFSYVNSFQCEKEARLALAYELGALGAAKAELNNGDADLEAVQRGLLYPSTDVLKYSVSYSRLSPKAKQYFQEAIGGQPFNLADALAANVDVMAAEQ